MKSFVLGGGCYWCLDAAYRVFDGVQDVISGYAGGDHPNPNYELVCTGTTGHAEVVKVVFDENIVPADIILDAYFTMHDPRQLNRQGNDIGTQYRSIMLYQDEEQRQLFEEAYRRAEEVWDGGLVTEIVPLEEFFRAEEHMQDFFKKNPTQAYCLAVTLPKVNKVRQHFQQYLLPAGS